MKRFVSLVFVLVSVFCYADSVQQGCVKTRGRMINGKHVPGQGLPGSIVSIKDRTAIGVKNSNGTFSFPVTDNHFRVDSVKKKDYVLLDADATSKTYTHTADTLFFVMETPEQILQDKLSTERRLRRSLQTKLQARENELDSLIAIQKISQEEYQQSLQKLYAEQSENDKFISDMAERYSTLDYDQMDEFYRQVSYYIEQCEFVKADSLLKSRGNLHAQLEAAKQHGQAIQQDEEKLQRAKVVHQHDIDELAKRCYSYFENFKMQHQNDSAAYYLKQRVQLDTTNVQWLDEYADFLDKYLAQYDNALDYLQQSLAIRKQVFGESHPDIAASYNNIGSVYDAQGDYTRALEYHQQSLAIMKQFFGESHPDIATSYNNIGAVYAAQGDYARALEYYQQSLAIWKQVYGESHPDVALSYNNIGSVYDAQGDYARALEYHQQSLAIRKQV
ncbi:MAG: tetratricopeptide repeat-containing protein, partial [Alistipes sp.]|nr:tetratricopeptide repeat-containing protein [Alistipes sp.]